MSRAVRNLDSPGLGMAGNCSWETHPTNRNKASTAISSPTRVCRMVWWEGADPAQHPLLTHTLPPRPHPLARDRQAGSRAPLGYVAWHWLPVTSDPQCLHHRTPSSPILCRPWGICYQLQRPCQLFPGEMGRSAISHGQALPGGPARLAPRGPWCHEPPWSSGPPCQRRPTPGSVSPGLPSASGH